MSFKHFDISHQDKKLPSRIEEVNKRGPFNTIVDNITRPSFVKKDFDVNRIYNSDLIHSFIKKHKNEDIQPRNNRAKWRAAFLEDADYFLHSLNDLVNDDTISLSDKLKVSYQLYFALSSVKEFKKSRYTNTIPWNKKRKLSKGLQYISKQDETNYALSAVLQPDNIFLETHLKEDIIKGVDLIEISEGIFIDRYDFDKKFSIYKPKNLQAFKKNIEKRKQAIINRSLFF